MPGIAVKDDFNMHLHRIGFEKTFLCGRASLELIAPIQTSTASDLTNPIFTSDGLSNTEFGRLTVGAKYLVPETCRSKLCVGLRAELPTDRDFGADPLEIDTKITDLTPYLGFSYRQCNWFAQGFASYHFPTGDMPRTPAGAQLGLERDPVELTLDASIGYWHYRSDCSWLKGLAPMFEVHFQTSKNGTRERSFPRLFFGDHIDTLNLLAGVQALMGQRITLTAGIAVPVHETASNFAVGPLAGVSTPTDRY